MTYVEEKECRHDPFAVSFERHKVIWRVYRCVARCRYCGEVIDAWYEWGRPQQRRHNDTEEL